MKHTKAPTPVRTLRPQCPPALGPFSLGHPQFKNSALLPEPFTRGWIELPRIWIFSNAGEGPDRPTPPPKSPVGCLNWSGLSAIAPCWGRFPFRCSFPEKAYLDIFGRLLIGRTVGKPMSVAIKGEGDARMTLNSLRVHPAFNP